MGCVPRQGILEHKHLEMCSRYKYMRNWQSFQKAGVKGRGKRCGQPYCKVRMKTRLNSPVLGEISISKEKLGLWRSYLFLFFDSFPVSCLGIFSHEYTFPSRPVPPAVWKVIWPWSSPTGISNLWLCPGENWLGERKIASRLLHIRFSMLKWRELIYGSQGVCRGGEVQCHTYCPSACTNSSPG